MNRLSVVVNDIYAIYQPVSCPKLENLTLDIQTYKPNKKPKDISKDDIEKDFILSL
jgi:hypothetical protein